MTHATSPLNALPFRLQGNSQTITLQSIPQNAIVTSSGSTLVIQQAQDQASTSTNLPLTPVTVDLPSIGGSTNEESGVLLCNLDDLSKYIPENFYSDFTMADQSGVSDYLQTVVAGKSNTATTTVSASNGSLNQQPSTIQLPISMTQTVGQATQQVYKLLKFDQSQSDFGKSFLVQYLTLLVFYSRPLNSLLQFSCPHSPNLFKGSQQSNM